MSSLLLCKQGKSTFFSISPSLRTHSHYSLPLPTVSSFSNYFFVAASPGLLAVVLPAGWLSLSVPALYTSTARTGLTGRTRREVSRNDIDKILKGHVVYWGKMHQSGDNHGHSQQQEDKIRKLCRDEFDGQGSQE